MIKSFLNSYLLALVIIFFIFIVSVSMLNLIRIIGTNIKLKVITFLLGLSYLITFIPIFGINISIGPEWFRGAAYIKPAKFLTSLSFSSTVILYIAGILLVFVSISLVLQCTILFKYVMYLKQKRRLADILNRKEYENFLDLE